MGIEQSTRAAIGTDSILVLQDGHLVPLLLSDVLSAVAGVPYWQSTAGAFSPQADNVRDLGTASLRIRTIYTTAADSKASQIVTASTTLTSTSPYRTIVNSASDTTITVPASPINDETRVIANVGAGTATVSYAGFSGAATRALAQGSAVTMAYNKTLGYWTTE